MSQIKLWNQGEKPLDLPLWHKHRHNPWKEIDLDTLFSIGNIKHVVLYDTLLERDYLQGLQYLYGQQLRIEFRDPTKLVREWMEEVDNVFLTNDPWNF